MTYQYSGTKCKQVQMQGSSDFNQKLAQLFGSRFKQYRSDWDRAGRNEYLPDFPLFIEVEPEYRCNMRCITCLHSLPKGKNPWALSDTMSPDVFEKICKEGFSHGLPAISISANNEGLLQKHLFEYLDIASNNNIMDIFLGTNGLLLTRELSKRLISSKLTRLLVSIDAANEITYEKMRQNKHYSDIVDNVNMFLEERNNAGSVTPLLRVSLVKTTINEYEVEAFTKLWIDKADIVSIQNYISPWLHWDSGDKLIPERIKDSSSPKICSALWQRILIRANGDVIACCNERNEHRLGNIAESSIRDMWHGDKMKTLREIHLAGKYESIKLCRECL